MSESITAPQTQAIFLDPIVDPEFRDWIIPLTPEEYSSLQTSIIEDGCRDPLVVWDGILIDGHHRFKICKSYNIPFKTVNKVFSDKLSAKRWMVKNQISRRNLESIQRIALVEKLEEEIAKKAKENLVVSTGGINPRPLVNLPKVAINTRKESAALARVSEKTYSKGKEVLKKASPEVYAKVIAGETSIHKAFSDIKTQEKRDKIQIDIKTNPQLPNGKYNVIYADPPWKYEFAKLTRDSIDVHYPSMELEEIKKIQLPIEDNAVLLLWTTAPKLEESFEVLNSWGFRYRSCAVWDKENFGMGYWFRIQHELLLIGVKGEFSAPLPENRRSSVIRYKKEQHSKKPEEMYGIIEKMFPGKKYLEVFARNKREGWESWGNQV